MFSNKHFLHAPLFHETADWYDCSFTGIRKTLLSDESSRRWKEETTRFCVILLVPTL